MSKILVLSADKWSMTDENTGEVLSGITVFAVNKYRDDTSSGKGLKPVKMNLPATMWNQLKDIELPALCDAEFAMIPIAGGKAGLSIVELNPIQSVDLFS